MVVKYGADCWEGRGFDFVPRRHFFWLPARMGASPETLALAMLPMMAAFGILDAEQWSRPVRIMGSIGLCAWGLGCLGLALAKRRHYAECLKASGWPPRERPERVSFVGELPELLAVSRAPDSSVPHVRTFHLMTLWLLFAPALAIYLALVWLMPFSGSEQAGWLIVLGALVAGWPAALAFRLTLKRQGSTLIVRQSGWWRACRVLEIPAESVERLEIACAGRSEWMARLWHGNSTIPLEFRLAEFTRPASVARLLMEFCGADFRVATVTSEAAATTATGATP
ncbi:MAG: hypothetical protein HXY23_14700 [Parvularculaceae bacterium]|nr:hypothetical protein [Parvularculaceae bacterium]